jgi:hypothetical protein
MIRHIVLLRFRQDARPERIAIVLAAIHALKHTLPGILAVHSGANVSPEGLGRGFTHAFTVDFEDEAARDRYLADADHAKAGAGLVAEAEGGVEGLLVVDFEIAQAAAS